MNRSASPAPAALREAIRDAIAEASEAQAVQLREPSDPNGDWTVRKLPIPAAALRQLPVAFAGAITTTTPATPAEALGAEIARRSVLAQLGLQLIEVRGDSEPATSIVGSNGQNIPVSGVIRAEFSLPRPAPFTLVNEDDEAAEAAILTDRTELGASGLRVYGFRHRLNRATLKDRAVSIIAAELAEAMMAGAAKLIDRVALEALATGDGLPLGDIRAAGAAGVQFDRLRAVIGRLGPSGEFALPGLGADRGELFHNGVRAALTDQAAGGWVGSWDTHAVFHSPEISILCTKTNNARGDLILSAWLGASGLSPIAGATKIWRLA